MVRAADLVTAKQGGHRPPTRPEERGRSPPTARGGTQGTGTAPGLPLPMPRPGARGSACVIGHAIASRRKYVSHGGNGDTSNTCPEPAGTREPICGHGRRGFHARLAYAVPLDDHVAAGTARTPPGRIRPLPSLVAADAWASRCSRAIGETSCPSIEGTCVHVARSPSPSRDGGAGTRPPSACQRTTTGFTGPAAPTALISRRVHGHAPDRVRK